MKYGVALVTARSGSKGLPNKNILPLFGRPLLDYAVSVGVGSTLLKETYISTDSLEYQLIAKNAGALSLGLREEALSSDSCKSIDVISSFLRSFEESRRPEFVVLLQPTSPIRTSDQVDECIKLHVDSGESVVSVAEIEEPHPYKLKKIDSNGCLVSFVEGVSSEVPRQELPSAYQLTGAIYVFSSTQVLERNSLFSEATIPYITDSFVNVDTLGDFEYLKYQVERGLLKLPN